MAPHSANRSKPVPASPLEFPLTTAHALFKYWSTLLQLPAISSVQDTLSLCAHAKAAFSFVPDRLKPALTLHAWPDSSPLALSARSCVMSEPWPVSLT